MHGIGSMFEIDFEIEYANFRFRLNFQISKLDMGFQINSNGFSKHRSFGHKFDEEIFIREPMFTFCSSCKWSTLNSTTVIMSMKILEI